MPRAPKQVLHIPPGATIADYPTLAGQLDPAAGTADRIPAGSGKDVGWVCDKAPDHRWAAPPRRRVANGAGCPCCTGKKPSVTNSLAGRFPAIAAELDLGAPATGGLTADRIIAGSHRRVGWRCSSCDHRWEAQVGPRTERGVGCPACAGSVATETDNLATARPDVAAQWHPARNGPVRPQDIRPGSSTRVWWLCPVHPDHEWRATPAARTAARPTGCPACSGYQLSATNNLAARFPAIAAQLDPDLNGDRRAEQLLAGTSEVVTWRCHRGPDHVWRVSVVSRTAQNNGCPIAVPEQPFDAIVVGEPQRAFYGSQFANTFPLLQHYGVDLWVPDVGGRVDPDSDIHELMMVIFGGLGKSERRRIQKRVIGAMEAATINQGRFLGGRPPYGYVIASAGPHPNPSKAVDGITLHVLEPDPVTGPVVQRIFDLYLGGTGLRGIAGRLNDEGIPCPSAHDPMRNPHRLGDGWQASTVRAVLTNPRYTGTQVWGRWHRVERLLDPTDVAAGTVTRFQRSAPERVVASVRPAHLGLVSQESFDRVQSLLTSSVAAGGAKPRSARAATSPYQLRGLLHCRLCGRRMAGHRRGPTLCYRCRAADLIPTQREGHPTTVNVREDRSCGCCRSGCSASSLRSGWVRRWKHSPARAGRPWRSPRSVRWSPAA